jgi:predicted regulator of Ras-like GTPase activity (Roadblock/LC7/MglB family)
MSENVMTAVLDLTRVPGARGALVVDAEAGVPVAAELADGETDTAFAALFDALFRRARDAARATGLGALRSLQLDATDGHVVVVGAGPLLVVVLAQRSAQLGLIRVQALRAAEELMP